MTLKELKTKVAESGASQFYLNFETIINLPQINYNTVLKGVPAFYEFITKQADGFEKFESLPNEFVRIKKRFSDAKKAVIDLLEQGNTSDHSWRNNFNFLINNNPEVYLFDSPETEFLIKLNKENNSYYQAAYEYLNGKVSTIQNKNYFIGCMLAYEFTSKDLSTIAERKEVEKKSIASTRADFQSKLGEAETHLAEYFTQANQKFINYSKIIDDLKIEKEKLYSDWFNKTSKEFSEFNVKSLKSIKDFEELYNEKLKLEAPATYWRLRAKKLRKEGYWWLSGLMACIGGGVWILIWVLNKISDGTFKQMFSETGIAIKWSIALITLISFLAFAIRTFSKLTFSSFHLVRDAEEREQLTYVYLALQNEKGIDKTERHLIMQSLFSRADSGLLKDDSGPTMPGNFADKMIK
jgi:Family of unknown function (DUF6161)